MNSVTGLVERLSEPIDFGNPRFSRALLGLGTALLLHDLVSSPNTAADYGDTLGRQVTNCVLQGTGKLAFELAGIKAGSSTLDPTERVLAIQVAEHPTRSFPDVAIGAPIREEAFFRTIPSMIADAVHPHGKNSKRWVLGTLSSLWFAKQHGTRQDGERVYPVEQFVAGMALWNLQRTKGTKHAMLAHSALNASSYPTMVLFAKDASRQMTKVSG